jgi:hypothetical protein
MSALLPHESCAGCQVLRVAARMPPLPPAPHQAACTPKELKELLSDCGVTACVAAPDQLSVSDGSGTSARLRPGARASQ